MRWLRVVVSWLLNRRCDSMIYSNSYGLYRLCYRAEEHYGNHVAHATEFFQRTEWPRGHTDPLSWEER